MSSLSTFLGIYGSTQIFTYLKINIFSYLKFSIQSLLPIRGYTLLKSPCDLMASLLFSWVVQLPQVFFFMEPLKRMRIFLGQGFSSSWVFADSTFVVWVAPAFKHKKWASISLQPPLVCKSGKGHSPPGFGHFQDHHWLGYQAQRFLGSQFTLVTRFY